MVPKGLRIMAGSSLLNTNWSLLAVSLCHDSSAVLLLTSPGLLLLAHLFHTGKPLIRERQRLSPAALLWKIGKWLYKT